ncbi:MAG: carbon storage regulator [Planctomycetaceae bacterium]|nr:carbon storage regulator [Planctomycetaceae bacterium]
MLVLSRKPGERILIGDDVVVTVVRIGPNNVRVGIEAPREMNIVREELCQDVATTARRPEDANASPGQHLPSASSS